MKYTLFDTVDTLQILQNNNKTEKFILCREEAESQSNWILLAGLTQFLYFLL